MIKNFSKTNTTTNSTGIIFLHGNSCDHSFFDQQFNDVNLNQYKLISIDLPGHGNSPKNENLYTLSKIRESISTTINDFDLEKVILVGHSLGGHLAIQSLSNINNVIGIFLIGTPLLTFPPALDKAFLPNPIIPLLFSDNLTDEQITLIAQNYSDNTDLSIVTKAISSTDKNFRKILAQDIMLGNSIDEIVAVQNSNIKCCIIQGENDTISNLEYLKNIENLSLWRNEIQVISDTGHSPQLDNAKIVNDLLSSYVFDLINQ